MPARPWEEARAWFGVEQVISQFYQFLSGKMSTWAKLRSSWLAVPSLPGTPQVKHNCFQLNSPSELSCAGSSPLVYSYCYALC